MSSAVLAREGEEGDHDSCTEGDSPLLDTAPKVGELSCCQRSHALFIHTPSKPHFESGSRGTAPV